MKTIGILGGMGPLASHNFLGKVINYCQKNYEAIQDTEFPEMILYSIGLEGFDETGIVKKEKVLKQLKKAILFLEDNCDFIVIPCNTIHCYINKLRKISKVPILSIIEETEKIIQKNKYSKILLLASQTTYKENIYKNYIEPDEKGKYEVEKLIENIMGGKITQTQKIIEIIKSYEKLDAILLGCTELPSALNSSTLQHNVLDTVDILAKATVDFSYN